MDSSSDDFASPPGSVQDDLRHQIAAVLTERADVITGDTVAIFPYSGAQQLDVEYCHKIGSLLTQLLSLGVRDGRLDARGSGLVADLHHEVIARSLPVTRLFTFAYLT